MRWGKKLLVANVVENSNERVVETGDVEQPDGLEMQAKLEPGENLDDLLKRANTSRQRYERIRELRHAELALVHGINRNKLSKAVMPALRCNHGAGNNSDDLAASS